METKITVIVPAYNAEKTILRTIESLIKQTYQNFKIIVINDGSVDNTLEILSSIDDDRLTIVNQNNMGVSYSRNKGIKLADTKYVAFLDADDEYLPEFLEIMLTEIKDNDALFSGSLHIYNDSIISNVSKKINRNYLEEYLKYKLKTDTNSWLIRSDFIKNNSLTFPTDISSGEDFIFFGQILGISNKVKYINQALTKSYREHDNRQLSNINLTKIEKDFKSVIRMIENSNININKKTNRILLNYRMKVRLTNNFYELLTIKIDKSIIKNEIKKYNKYYRGLSYINGLRSLKLNITKIKIKLMLLF